MCPPGCGINPDGFTLEGHTLGLGLVPQSERSRADALGNSEPAQINAVHRTGLQLLLWRKMQARGPSPAPRTRDGRSHDDTIGRCVDFPESRGIAHLRPFFSIFFFALFCVQIKEDGKSVIPHV